MCELSKFRCRSANIHRNPGSRSLTLAFGWYNMYNLWISSKPKAEICGPQLTHQLTTQPWHKASTGAFKVTVKHGRSIWAIGSFPGRSIGTGLWIFHLPILSAFFALKCILYISVHRKIIHIKCFRRLVICCSRFWWIQFHSQYLQMIQNCLSTNLSPRRMMLISPTSKYLELDFQTLSSICIILCHPCPIQYGIVAYSCQDRNLPQY